MKWFYLIVCGLMSLFLPHITAPATEVATQIMLQVLFIFVGIWGFITYDSY